MMSYLIKITVYFALVQLTAPFSFHGTTTTFNYKLHFICRGHWKCGFFLYADRNHDGIIDGEDIEKIRNPVYLNEWNSFGINKHLPIVETEFYSFMKGNSY